MVRIRPPRRRSAGRAGGAHRVDPGRRGRLFIAHLRREFNAEARPFDRHFAGNFRGFCGSRWRGAESGTPGSSSAATEPRPGRRAPGPRRRAGSLACSRPKRRGELNSLGEVLSGGPTALRGSAGQRGGFPGPTRLRRANAAARGQRGRGRNRRVYTRGGGHYAEVYGQPTGARVVPVPASTPGQSRGLVPVGRGGLREGQGRG